MANRKQAVQAPALEWIAAGLGLVLILGVGAVIGREAVTAEESQLPAVEVRALRIMPVATGFVVEFEARNHSPGTAAAVEIEGKSADETSTAMVDYVAGNSSAKGGLFFKQDPRGGALELRALGFQTP